jgi:hypothetical protein
MTIECGAQTTVGRFDISDISVVSVCRQEMSLFPVRARKIATEVEDS